MAVETYMLPRTVTGNKLDEVQFWALVESSVSGRMNLIKECRSRSPALLLYNRHYENSCNSCMSLTLGVQIEFRFSANHRNRGSLPSVSFIYSFCASNP